MKLKERVGWILLATFLPLLFLLYGVTRHIVLGAHETAELEQMRQHVGRVVNALRYEQTGLATVVHDWSSWDDTCAFIRDGNAAFVRANLMDETFANLKIDCLAFLDATGAVRWASSYDGASKKPAPFPAALRAALAPGSPLLFSPGATEGRAGLIRTPEGTLVAALCPILDSFNRGPARGTLLMGRWLDAEMIARLGSATELPVRIRDVASPALPAAFAEARRALLPAAPAAAPPAFLKAWNRDTLSGFTLLRDLQDAPALLAGVTLPRTIYHQGLREMRYFLCSLAAIGLSFALLMLLLLERSVIRRLTRLNREIDAIRRRDDLSLRVGVGGRDEVSDLECEINSMLQSLEESRRTLLAGEEQLHRLSVHVHAVREEEGTRIARRIHDDLGQQLTVLKMELTRLLRAGAPGGPAPGEAALRGAAALVDQALQTVKTLSLELRPTILDDAGLGAALEWQAGAFSRQSGIRCTVIVEPEDLSVRGPAATALFRVAQEALTNVARHAGATAVEVTLDGAADGALRLDVNDNGHGITPEELARTDAFGLAQMRERVRSLGGTIRWEGRPGKGTRVVVTAPPQAEGPKNTEGASP